MVPTTQINNASPILPTDLTMAPGVANIPEPITRDMTKTDRGDQLNDRNLGA